MRIVEVDDPDDPRLVDYRSLTDVALRSSIEAPHGLFIAEGALVIERARAAGYALRSALMSRPMLINGLISERFSPARASMVDRAQSW